MAVLQHSITRRNNISTITIGGSLDASSAPAFAQKLEDEIKKGSLVFIISMEKLDYIASAGMGVLISINEKLVKEKKQLRICKMNDKIKNIFKMLGFLNLFKIYKNEEEAENA